jgi:hypothetical protein
MYKTATASAWVPVIALLPAAIDRQVKVSSGRLVRGGKKGFVDRTRWAGPSVKHVSIPWAGPVHNSQTLPFNLRVLHTQEVRSELTNSSNCTRQLSLEFSISDDQPSRPVLRLCARAVCQYCSNFDYTFFFCKRFLDTSSFHIYDSLLNILH